MECVKAELCKETRLVFSAGWLRIPSLIMKGISTGRYIWVGDTGLTEYSYPHLVM